MLRKKEKTSKDIEVLEEMVNNEGDICDVANIRIQIDDESNSFPILIDGKVFGPFQKIQITPYKIDDKNVTMPIMTYLQVE